MQISPKPIAPNSPKQRAARIPVIAVALSRTSTYDAAVAPSPPRLGPLSDALAASPLGMKIQRFDEQFAALIELAARLCRETEAGSLLVMLEGPTEWDRLHATVGDLKVVVA